jgi:hypothetical protein
MKKAEVKELYDRSRADGAALYSAAETVHKFGLAVISLAGLAGVVLGFSLVQDKRVLGGFLVWLITGGLCFLLFALQVMMTNTAKVLVHLLFVNLFDMKGDNDEFV